MKNRLLLLVIITLIIGCLPLFNASNNVYADNTYSIIELFQQDNADLKDSIKDLLSKGVDYFKELIKKFSDMGNHWADVTVGKLVELGVVDGYKDGTFKPDNTITRSEFCKIIRTAFKMQEVNGNSFDDTSHWAKNEIHTLVINGVIDATEYGNNYEPNENITRIEMAKMIVRAIGLDNDAQAKINHDTKFSDNDDIKGLDRGYVIIASEKGIINGYPEDKTFKPNGEATRAEASKMVITALEYISSQEQIEEIEETENDHFVEPDIEITYDKTGNESYYFALELGNIEEYDNSKDIYKVKVVCTTHEKLNSSYHFELFGSGDWVLQDLSAWRVIEYKNLGILNKKHYTKPSLDEGLYTPPFGDVIKYEISIKNETTGETKKYYEKIELKESY